MSKYIDYKVYEKHLMLTLSVDFNREDGICLGARN